MRPFLSLHQLLKNALGVGFGPFELENDAISCDWLRNEDKCVINGEALHRFRKMDSKTALSPSYVAAFYKLDSYSNHYNR